MPVETTLSPTYGMFWEPYVFSIGNITIESTDLGELTATTEREVSPMTHMSETLQEIIDNYTYHAYSTHEYCMSSVQKADFKADRAKLVEAFNTWVESMDFATRFGYNSYTRFFKGNDGEFRVLYNDYDGAYISRLVEDIIPRGDALRALREVAPDWIEVTEGFSDRFNRRGVSFTSKKSDLYARMVEKEMSEYRFTYPRYIYGAPRNGYRSKDVRQAQVKMASMKAHRATLLRDLLRSEAPVKPSLKKPVRSGGGNFDAFLSTIRSERKTSDLIVERFDVQPHGLVSSLTWGIEVESGGARGVICPDGWDERGDG